MDRKVIQREISQLQREARAIMLEEHTPAYARTLAGRRANDLIWKRANGIRRALAEAGIFAKVSVRTIVPHNHRHVSGLNVPSNYQIVVGREQENAFSRVQRRAIKGLEARNA